MSICSTSDFVIVTDCALKKQSYKSGCCGLLSDSKAGRHLVKQETKATVRHYISF